MPACRVRDLRKGDLVKLSDEPGVARLICDPMPSCSIPAGMVPPLYLVTTKRRDGAFQWFFEHPDQKVETI